MRPLRTPRLCGELDYARNSTAETPSTEDAQRKNVSRQIQLVGQISLFESSLDDGFGLGMHLQVRRRRPHKSSKGHDLR